MSYRRLRRRRARRMRMLMTAGAAAALIFMLFCIWMAVGRDLLDNWKADKVEDKTKDLYYNDASPFDVFFGACAEELDYSELEPEATMPPVQEDFIGLAEANPDVVGWLNGPGRIDHPVVQADNSYYLEHDFFGEEDANGTLFLNMYNKLLPRDNVLLIHGHNMKHGAMFGELQKFAEYGYMCENPMFSFRTIYDPEDVYYVPVFAFSASMNHNDPTYTDITAMLFDDDIAKVNSNGTVRNAEEYAGYLELLAERSIWEAPVDVNEEDALLMLVTCSYDQDNGRFVLVCRRLRDGETPESVSAIYADALK